MALLKKLDFMTKLTHDKALAAPLGLCTVGVAQLGSLPPGCLPHRNIECQCCQEEAMAAVPIRPNSRFRNSLLDCCPLWKLGARLDNLPR